MGGTSPEVDSTQLVERRRDLVLRFCDLPGRGSALALQHALAAEIRAAEAGSASVASRTWARHKHLVRIIGDSLAFSLIHEHTIRTLGRHPGSAAGIMGQGDDFSFVMDVAEMLANSGYVPVLCDLTNLLRVGDIVAVAADHVLVLECKRSKLPRRLTNSGRLARQRARGTRAAEYLHESRAIETDGAERQALSLNLPDPHWPVLTNLAEQLSSDSGGSDLVFLGDGDAVMLITEVSDLESVFTRLDNEFTGKKPTVGQSSDIIRDPRWNCPSPLLYPVQPWLRHDLLEGEATVIRVVDIDHFTVTRNTPSGRLAEMQARSTEDGAILSVLVEGEQRSFGPGILDRVFYTPTPLVEMREALLACIDSLLTVTIADESTLSQPGASEALSDEASGVNTIGAPTVRLANGDDVTYGTVYLMPDGNDPIVVYEVPTDGEHLLHFAWDPSRKKVVGGYINGVMVKL
jgi:hypothetical protein